MKIARILFLIVAAVVLAYGIFFWNEDVSPLGGKKAVKMNSYKMNDMSSYEGVVNSGGKLFEKPGERSHIFMVRETLQFAETYDIKQAGPGKDCKT